MKNSILIIANDELTIYNFRREILKAFYSHGFKVTVCIPKGNYTNEIELCGCKVINIAINRHGTNLFQDLKFLQSCIKIIKSYKPDIVLTYTVKPNIYGSLACQIMKTSYINNVTGLGSVLQKNSILAKIVLRLQKIAYRKSSCVFFQNKSNYEELLEQGVINNSILTEILPGSGVNLELYFFVPMRKADGMIKFIIVSRIRKDKGYGEFFEAAEIIKRKFPNTEFHVVGWFEEVFLKERMDELIRKGVVIYHGQQMQEEVHKLIGECDCVLLPSYHEGMANVLLEAASTGRPVIATNIPGCKETFDEGITGFGCEAKNVESLTNALEEFINTPYFQRVEMGKAGRKKMEKEFDRSIVAKKYISQINNILRRKNLNGTL